MTVSKYEALKRSNFMGQLPLDGLEMMYEQWLAEPTSVSRDWQVWFEQEQSGGDLATLDRIRSDSKKGRVLSSADSGSANRNDFHTADVNPLSHPSNNKDRSIGFEIHHIDDDEKRQWWEARSQLPIPALEDSSSLHAYKKLFAAAELERYLGTQFVGQKRFSLEGSESMIYLLDQLMGGLAKHDYHDIVMGMAHRGRLNVLVNTLGMPVGDLVAMFRGNHEHTDTSGDVKYHLGYSSDIIVDGKPVHLSLACNPSHLECIAPVVMGNVRARQDMQSQGLSNHRSANILIHGDAAIMGQGVVYETTNLSRLKGYHSGGAIHIVANNQVGFTTDPDDSRSTPFSTAVARAFEYPVLHVNGYDIAAIKHAASLAVAYKELFNEDVFIDLIGFRRLGHNEADDPSFTQPSLYQMIKTMSSIDKWFKNDLNQGQNATAISQIETDIKKTIKSGGTIPQLHESTLSTRKAMWSRYTTQVDLKENHSIVLSEQHISHLKSIILPDLPDSFTAHPQILKFIAHRAQMVDGTEQINWATGEAIAMAHLLSEGYAIRLAGQDVQRGTFTQRHAVYHDQENSVVFTPLEAAIPKQSLGNPLQLINSPLAEFACLGFEYGYSETHPNALVIWEAQFGDFANGAQIIIDQFIASGWQKWQRMSGLVMMLPHVTKVKALNTYQLDLNVSYNYVPNRTFKLQCINTITNSFASHQTNETGGSKTIGDYDTQKSSSASKGSI